MVGIQLQTRVGGMSAVTVLLVQVYLGILSRSSMRIRIRIKLCTRVHRTLKLHLSIPRTHLLHVLHLHRRVYTLSTRITHMMGSLRRLRLPTHPILTSQRTNLDQTHLPTPPHPHHPTTHQTSLTLKLPTTTSTSEFNITSLVPPLLPPSNSRHSVSRKQRR